MSDKGGVFDFCKHFVVCFTGARSTYLYKAANEKIERTSQAFIHFMLVNTTILMLVPLFISVLNFYCLDAGKESFFLFFPTWFVIFINTNTGRFVRNHMLCV